MAKQRIKLTPEQRESVGKLAGLLTQEQLADFLGVSRSTFKNLLERDSELSSLYKKGRAKVLAGVAQNLVQKALDGNLTAAIFYLKTQASWHEKPQQDSAADTKPRAEQPTEIIITAGELKAS